jgi:predicted small integral membrane protein
MAWTHPTAIFFIAVALLLCGMTLLEIYRPTTARTGLLRIETTRGDRLFISLLTAGWINLIWMAFTDASQWIALAISLAVSILILARG